MVYMRSWYLFFQPNGTDNFDPQGAEVVRTAHLVPRLFEVMLRQLHGVSLLVRVEAEQEFPFFVGRESARDDDVATGGEAMPEEDTGGEIE